jgi:hypothetical protein
MLKISYLYNNISSLMVLQKFLQLVVIKLVHKIINPENPNWKLSKLIISLKSFLIMKYMIGLQVRNYKTLSIAI